MSHVEEAILRRYSGLKIVAFGAAVAVIGALPLLLYIELRKGNGSACISHERSVIRD